MKRSKHAPRDLTAERIRDVALALIDRTGLDGFSTRKLGEALGCEAMAIYYYYPSKEALLDAVVDQMMAGVAAEVGTETADWVDAMRKVAHAYRNVARLHPKAFPLLATRRFASESTYAFLDELFALAKKQRITDRTVARFYRVVSSYCNGFALNELAQRREPTTASQRAKFARIAAVSAYLEPEHADDTFSFGLEVLLDALAQAASKRKAA
ncbi:MAG: TetR family transcriptional regulator [Kofleriaceae bacterium]|nr:TetR family transcriptional regulator [Kofleriaceae bacterium]